VRLGDRGRLRRRTGNLIVLVRVAGVPTVPREFAMSTVGLEATTGPAGEPTATTTLDPEGHYEVVRGIFVEKPAMGAFETWIASELFGWLVRSAEVRSLGRIVCEMLFCLDAAVDLQRRPDLAFISNERWPRNRAVPRTAAWDVVPFLAIEIIRPTSLASGVLVKVGEYFQHGVRSVWVVYPIEEQVYVYDSVTSVRILTRADRLAVPSILPQLELPLESLFETESPVN